MELSNLVCIVTGGTKGIGLAVSRGLFRKGAVVFLCGRSKEEARLAAENIDAKGQRVFSFKADVTKNTDVKRLISKVVKKFKRVDVLINCAGIFGPFGNFEENPFEDNLLPLGTNLIGSMRCIYNLVPQMKKQRSGRIILFSGGGIGGETPLVNAASYFVSKGAISILGEVLADELQPFGVTINAVLPGQVLTDSTRKTLKISPKLLGPVLEKATENLRETGGQSVEPVVDLVCFLVSKRASKITGRLISAKWDSIDDLKKNLTPEKYKLRRIEGKIYSKKGV